MWSVGTPTTAPARIFTDHGDIGAAQSCMLKKN